MHASSPAGTQLLKIAEVARRLQCSVRTVWALIAAGDIRAVRLTRRATRVEEAELERFIDRARGRSS